VLFIFDIRYGNLYLPNLRSKKLFKSSATIIGPIIAALIIVIGAERIGQDIWLVLTAVGTVGVVIVAVFYPLIIQWWQRPKLEIGFFEPEPPHLRKTPAYQSGQLLQGVTLYPLSIRLRNIGKIAAKNAQPQISSMGEKVSGKWETQKNWIPAPVRWGFDEFALPITGRPTEEKDLIPDRAYFFNFGVLRTDHPNHFLLNPIAMPGGQKTKYPPGKFCFELTVYAQGADPAIKYFHIEWLGGCTQKFQNVKKQIIIKTGDKPPWPKH
jgi:hypothetical protein